MAEHDPAEIRLWKLTLVRLSGVLLAAAGLGLVALEPFGPASRYAGLAVILAGTALVAFGSRFFRP
ncbi:hypothetical protein [Thermaurantiacus sp.]